MHESKKTNIINGTVVVLTGPTASGKSACALELAKRLPIEIINGDMAQMYVPLNVATAKPDLTTTSVPHHLYNVRDEPHDYTVVEYRQAVSDVARDVIRRGKIPIVVGGSLFYIKSLIYALNVDAGSATYQGPEDNLWERLQKIDPERAVALHPSDRYRIKRALAIWQTTGVKPSEYAPTYDPIARLMVVYLTRNRDELAQRIQARIQQMVNDGLLEEAQKLRNSAWEQFVIRKKIIGYEAAFEYLDNPTQENKRKMIDSIAAATRAYAKRQDTAWRSLCKAVQRSDDGRVTMHTMLVSGQNVCGDTYDQLVAIVREAQAAHKQIGAVDRT